VLERPRSLSPVEGGVPGAQEVFSLSNLTTVARRLAALFLTGLGLWMSPVVAAFNDTTPVLGYPAPVLFLLTVWVVLIALAAAAVGRLEP